MRIATYNIWDAPYGMPARLHQIEAELRSVQAEVLCLQEVGGAQIQASIAEACGYPYACHHPEAGLSVLSRYPVAAAQENRCGISVLLRADSLTLRVTNVHLPWNSASAREQAMVDILREAPAADYALLAGDFNASDSSSIHHFLKGDRSLLGADAYYFDLAEAYAQLTNTPLAATLNFRENPRWGTVNEVNTIEVNQRFDRIYLENPYPRKYPLMTGFSLFGTAVSPETGLCASDHYGVWAELTF